MKYHSKNSLMSSMMEALEDQNPEMYQELARTKTMGTFLEERAASVVNQMERMIESGLQEREAFEVVKEQVLLMK